MHFHQAYISKGSPDLSIILDSHVGKNSKSDAAMATVSRKKWPVIEANATVLWSNLKEPATRITSTSFKPLHLTLFSVNAIKYTQFYKSLDTTFRIGTRFEDSIKQELEVLANGVKVLFYEDSGWFGNNKTELKRFAAWCDAADGDYTITGNKAAAYMTYRVDEKRTELDIGGSSRNSRVLLETTLFNKARDIIPVLERYAKWQGYTELATGLSKQRAVEVVYTGLLRASNTAKVEQPIDYAADSRRMTKRFTEDERTRLLDAMWSSTGQSSKGTNVSFQVMRQLVEQLLPAADGRRGEDLREVSSSNTLQKTVM